MHSYDDGNQSYRPDIYAKIALFTFVAVLLADSFKSGNFSLTSFFGKYGWTSSLISITFSILYTIYDQFVWKLNPFNKTPNLSGTWVGFARNSHFNPLRLELMQIKQTWTKIGIKVDVYEESESEPENWLKANRIGTEYSICTRVNDCDLQDSFFTFSYYHKAKADKQQPFNGSMFLTYTKRKNNIRKISLITLFKVFLNFLKGHLVSKKLHEAEIIHCLEGEYANTKKGRYINEISKAEEDFNGLSGRIVFHKVSSKSIERNEVFELNGILEMLSRLQQEINNKVRKISSCK